MPWSARPSGAEALATTTPRLVPFYDGILRMSLEALLASWAAEPNLDEPRSGPVRGADQFARWASGTRDWLVRADAEPRPVDLIVTPSRTVEEVAVDLTLDGKCRELPVAIVAERDAQSHLIAMRVYHSLWPLTRDHEVRSPLLSGDPNLAVPDVVGDYQRALAAGDLEGTLAAYEDDAVVREPAGGPYVYAGKQQLRHIYSLQFASGAGIPLEHCTVTDDGTSCAIEYNAARWGHTSIPPQAGIAVYQRGDSGKLAFARIYDDIAPPAASDSSRTPAAI